MHCTEHAQFASIDGHAQLTRCFSAVAELLVDACFVLIFFVVLLLAVFLMNKDVYISRPMCSFNCC